MVARGLPRLCGFQGSHHTTFTEEAVQLILRNSEGNLRANTRHPEPLSMPQKNPRVRGSTLQHAVEQSPK
jgi:hypothetical protein